MHHMLINNLVSECGFLLHHGHYEKKTSLKYTDFIVFKNCFDLKSRLGCCWMSRKILVFSKNNFAADLSWYRHRFNIFHHCKCPSRLVGTRQEDTSPMCELMTVSWGKWTHFYVLLLLATFSISSVPSQLAWDSDKIKTQLRVGSHTYGCLASFVVLMKIVPQRWWYEPKHTTYKMVSLLT
jgi:hypothetical protein